MNNFEVMCRVAARESWSPNGYGCAPCCHERVVGAFPLLIRGYVPGTPAWEAATRLHHPGGDAFSLSMLDQDALSRLLAGVSIARVKASDSTGRWRDILAIGLLHTVDVERESLRVTCAWHPQLLDIRASRMPVPGEPDNGRREWRVGLELVPLRPEDILSIPVPGQPDRGVGGH